MKAAKKPIRPAPAPVPAAPLWMACLLVLAFYAAVPNWREGVHHSYDYYPKLAEGIMDFRLDLPKAGADVIGRLADPYDPAVNTPIRDSYMIGDLSYFKGRLFIYFGPTPALLLFIPWKLVTGLVMTQCAAGYVFCVVGFLALVDCYRGWCRRHSPVRGSWRTFWEVLALGIAGMAPALLARMWVYEVAIVAGGCLFAVALALFLRGLHADARTRRLLLFALSGLSCGLAIGARPNLLFGCGAIAAAVPLLGCASRSIPWRRSLVEAAAFAAPLGLCLAGLFWYNYARFGNPLEFGQSYQLAGVKVAGRHFLSLQNVPDNLMTYAFRLPRLIPYFPFLLTPGAPMEVFADASRIPHTPEGAVGLGVLVPLVWFCIPAVLCSLRVPGFRRDGRGFLALVLVASLGNLLTPLCASGSNVRYCGDFFPTLLLFSILATHLGGGGRPFIRSWTRRLYLAACAVSVAAVCCYSLQYRWRFMAAHPEANCHLFQWLSRPTLAWEEFRGRQFGGVEMEFDPGPDSRGGQTEGLFYCSGDPALEGGTGGDYLKCGFVIRRPGPGLCQIGYADGSGQVRWGAAFSPGSSGLCRARLRLGSLFPPFAHPYFSGIDARSADALVNRVQVVVDGQDVLDFRESRLEVPYPSVSWTFPAPRMEYAPFDGRIVSWRYCAAN